MEAARALGEIGPPAREAIRALEKLARGVFSPGVKRAAKEALRKIRVYSEHAA